MRKRILKILMCSVLFVNLISISAKADEFTLTANDSKNENTQNKTPSYKPSGGGGSSSNSNVGTRDNPYKNYLYTPENSSLNDTFSNFAGEGTDGSNSIYRDRYVNYSESEEDGNVTRNYIPSVKFEKSWNYHTQEISRVTDYYTWTCTGEERWSTREGQVKTVIFNQVGKYTVSSVPHQIVKTEKWKSAISTAYDQFADGTTNTIKSFYWEGPHETTIALIDRTDLKRTWVFEITPEEVGKPITLPPKGGTPDGGKELTSADVKWDTQLIQ